ncbi:MAG: SDR family oxidoreductase [Candidatus Binatia bacterium]
MARVLIAGCGDVGTELGVRLKEHGHVVWGLRRSADAFPLGISPLVADLTKPDTLQTLPPRLDFVVYTAAPDHASEETYHAVYVEGVRNLLTALQRQQQQMQRFFFTSSTGVYAQTSGEWVDECSPAEPVHFSGTRLLAAEDELLNSSFPATVVRLGGIYGPGRTRLLTSVRNGTAVCLDQAPHYTNRIHRDDCAGALQHLLSLPQPARLYLGVDHEPAEYWEVVRWLASRLGVPAPQSKTPREPQSRAQRSNKRCRNARLVATGYRFRYPTFREGYAALIAAS